ncbi:MAG TPA: hypothetical protein VHO03_18150 [Ignavibacteriales bacterium]|nr:hypothetical protein [Ignavibacteriales bacterium]
MDTPDGFEAPQWDVNLSTPVMDTTYTLADAIKKSDMIKSYPAGSPKENLLYYADNKPIEKVTVGDNLKIDQIVAQNTAGVSIGNINIAAPAPSSTSIAITSIWGNLIPNQSVPLPPAAVDINQGFGQINEFEHVVLQSGSLELSIQNSVAVNFEIDNFKIFNTDDPNNPIGSVAVIPVPPAGNNPAVVTIPLNPGARISNKLSFSGHLTTPGSGTTFITIPPKAITITSSFKNPVVSEVNGQIPAKAISTQKSFELDNQTKFQTVVIDQGSMSLTLKNNIDIDLVGSIELSSIYKTPSSQQPISIPLNVSGNSETSIPVDLSGSVLKSGGAPTNLISYTINVSTVSSGTQYRTIKSTDNISPIIEMSQLSLRSITGIVKPTTIDIKPTTVSINLGDMKEKFRYAKLNFKDPDLKLYLKPSSQFKVKVDGTVKAKGYANTLKFSDYISNLNGQVDSLVEVPSADLAQFLSSFAPNFPSELTISGTATVNPDSDPATIYKVAQSDSITGHAEITFPLNAGISDGEFTDTTKLNLKDNLKKEINKIQSIVLTLQITNGLPASVKWTGSFLDATEKIKLLDLPPNRKPEDRFILVPGAAVNSDGKVTAPASRTETVELTGSDAEKFVNSSFIISNVAINTSGATSGSASPVEFKITDSIRLKASATVVYRVNEK